MENVHIVAGKTKNRITFVAEKFADAFAATFAAFAARVVVVNRQESINTPTISRRLFTDITHMLLSLGHRIEFFW